MLGLLAAGALLWWTLHDVSLSDVWTHLTQVDPVLFALAVVLATVMFPLRCVRWRYLLQLEGVAPPFIPLWHATAIGFMVTNLLPARTGEFARAYAARQLVGTRFTTAFGSIAIERVLDGLTLVALLLVGIWGGGFATDTSVGSLTLGQIAQLAGLVFGAALVVAMIFVRWPHPALNAAGVVLHKLLPERWAAGAVRIIEGFVSGLDSLQSWRRFTIVTLWSMVVWLTGAASFWVAFLAFGIEVPWSAALLLQSLLTFGIAVQFSPGFFGQFEAIARVTLALYGVGTSEAVSYAIGFHVGGFIPITVLGLWSLSRARLHLADLRAPDQSSDLITERNGHVDSGPGAG